MLSNKTGPEPSRQSKEVPLVLPESVGMVEQETTFPVAVTLSLFAPQEVSNNDEIAIRAIARFIENPHHFLLGPRL